MLSTRAGVWITILLALCLSVTQAQSESPRQGLMWNRTGLPAVFPLQVKTHVGQDYVLLLSEPETGADALAAYITGGQFFRVLVPPGTYRVRFASGIAWQGEDKMFGERGQTQVIEMPKPLTFEVIGLRTKGGHIIDLTAITPGEITHAPTGPLQICQYLTLSEDDVLRNENNKAHKRYRKIPPPLPMTIHSRYCWPT